MLQIVCAGVEEAPGASAVLGGDRHCFPFGRIGFINLIPSNHFAPRNPVVFTRRIQTKCIAAIEMAGIFAGERIYVVQRGKEVWDTDDICRYFEWVFHHKNKFVPLRHCGIKSGTRAFPDHWRFLR